MESVLCKEQNSTCQQTVWDATTMDTHHDDQVPNTWWAAENTSHASAGMQEIWNETSGSFGIYRKPPSEDSAAQ